MARSRFRPLPGAYTAKALIVAAGRWSQFTADRTLPPGPKWIGVKAHFREIGAEPSTDLYFFENGYCGVQPVAADVVNACAMVRSDHATSLEEVFGLHPKLAERAAGWQAVTQPISTAPLVYREPQPFAATCSLSATPPHSSIPLPEMESRSRCAAGESLQSACVSSFRAEIRWRARSRPIVRNTQAICSADLRRCACSLALFASRHRQAGRL